MMWLLPETAADGCNAELSYTDVSDFSSGFADFGAALPFYAGARKQVHVDGRLLINQGGRLAVGGLGPVGVHAR